MQNPPPPPPGPPMSYPPATSGIDKRTGAMLSYVLGWVTGIIFLFVGKGDPDVKYHAAQSIVFFGSLTIINIILNFFYGISGVGTLFRVLNSLVGLFGFIMWIVCLVKAYSGNGARFQIPVVGGVVSPYAEQIANSV